MTLESALYAIGTGDATLNALISGRMVRDRLPHGHNLPAVVYRSLTNTPQLAHDGQSGVDRVRYQLDCWDDSPDGAEALQNAVVNAFAGYAGTTGSRKLSVFAVEVQGSIPDPETALSRRVIDLLIWDEGDT